MTADIRVLVTGGSGFLGNAIIKALQEKHPKWRLFILDVCPPANPDQKVGYERADITFATEVERAIADIAPTIIVHTAGIVPNGQARYSNKPAVKDRVFAINYGGTQNVVDAAKKHGVRALIYTSSCTVISDDLAHDYPHMNEEIPTGSATLPYGASKAPAERLVLSANSDTLSTCALRPATIIGPEDSFGVIATIHTCIANFTTPWIIGTGDNMYDFVYITNVADAHVLAIENLLSSRTAAGQAMFVSNQEPIYFRDFMMAIWAEFGHVPPFQVRIPAAVAGLAGYVFEWVSWIAGAEATLSRGSVRDAVGIRYSDNAKAKKILGYVPRVKFAEAVKMACQDYKRILAEKGGPQQNGEKANATAKR
ncbi:hypothetical protein H2203_001037 [Taxawa tesnikishii (nom. ined.)]|nr:hypothetical protein H2203_001037 [Dothideales sp. JES 119]